MCVFICVQLILSRTTLEEVRHTEETQWVKKLSSIEIHNSSGDESFLWGKFSKEKDTIASEKQKST